MVSISVIMATARDNCPIVGLPNLHMLQPTIESLNSQTFKDFEFIMIDALYNKRSKLFEGDPFHKERSQFTIKHIPVEHNNNFNHRFWLDNKRWNVCGTLNTGIIHAEGELLVRIDDCSEFESDYLKKFWDGYQSGYFPMAMHIKYLEGRPAVLNKEYLDKRGEVDHYRKGLSRTERDSLLKKLYGENGLIRDTRYNIVKKEGGRKIAPPEWYYGYSSVPLEAALKVNGYDELFDGDKSLEDADMGSRLEMAGYKNKFLLDVNHQVIEHEHGPIAEDLFDKNTRPIKCNYAIYLTNRNKNRWKANSGILSEKDVEFIREESLKSPCSPTSNFYDDNCRGKMFDIWVRNQPMFDLKEERKFYM
jgi:glycosyltransferase involved in cell wall biosynthesis